MKGKPEGPWHVVVVCAKRGVLWFPRSVPFQTTYPETEQKWNIAFVSTGARMGGVWFHPHERHLSTPKAVGPWPWGQCLCVTRWVGWKIVPLWGSLHRGGGGVWISLFCAVMCQGGGVWISLFRPIPCSVYLSGDHPKRFTQNM